MEKGKQGRRGGGKDIVADKEFEIFDDTYVYDSQGNENGNAGDAGIHRRSVLSRKWTNYESESSPKFSPFSTIRSSVKSLTVYTWKTAWVCVQLGRLPQMPGTKSDLFSHKE